MDNINNEEENFLNKISSKVSRSEEILVEAIAYVKFYHDLTLYIINIHVLA